MRRTVDRQTLFVVLACGVVSFIAVLSFLPHADKKVLHTQGRFHSLGHFLIFSLLAYVLARISKSLRTRLLLVAAALIFGLGIEMGECLGFRSGLEWDDVLVDWMGVVAGTLMAIVSTLSRPTIRTR